MKVEAVQLSFVILILVIAVTTAMYFNDFRNGDEVLTYSGANSSGNIWMFSVDKIWYSGQEIKNFLSVSPENRFDYRSVVSNSLLDSGNNFLYYLFVHTVSSMVPEYSFSKWCGFFVNIIFFIGTLLILFKLGKIYLLSKNLSFVVLLLYLCMNGLRIVTFLRSYQMLIFFTLFLFYRHLLLCGYMEGKEGCKPKCHDFALIGFICILSFWSSFLTSVIVLVLGVIIVFHLIKNIKHKNVVKQIFLPYLFTITISTMIALLGIPTFLSMMLDKLRGDSGNKSLIADTVIAISNFLIEMFGNHVTLLMTLLFGFVVTVHEYRKGRRFSNLDSKWQMLILFMIGYLLVSAILTRSGARYLWPVFPFILILFGKYLQNIYDKNLILWKKFLLALLVIVICASGIYSYQYQKFQSEIYFIQRDRREAIENSGEDIAVFIRNHGMGYDYVPLLMNFSDVMVIERPTQDYRNYNNELMLQNSESICVINVSGLDVNSDIEDWLSSELGYIEFDVLYTVKSQTIYRFRK